MEPATVEPLVYRIAVNLATNRRRMRSFSRWMGLDAASEAPDPDPRADVSLDAWQMRAAVRSAVEALPEKLKRVVLLTEFSGLSYSQVASALNIPEGTVGSRRNAALAALEVALEAHGHDQDAT